MIIRVTNKNKDFDVILDNDFPIDKYGKMYVMVSNGMLYPHLWINGKNVKVSRLIMNFPKRLSVDHINGDTLDNRKCNLRICTHKENMRNRKLNKNSNTGYKGVFIQTSWYKRKDGSRKTYFCAQIFINGKNKSLGYFNNPKDAAIKYNQVAKKIYGDFARLNVL